ncbi:MAG: hypothetical protein LBO82_08130 [Synergistaceae bacterium]|jgi:uncharacterized membrane protein YccF (DUF307 family)|nr:hypothetical protein [Synergistaceae bacterium]
MRTLGNILWHFPCFGFLQAFVVFIVGTILTITIVGSPIGLGLIQYSRFLLAPFSYEMVDQKTLGKEQSKAWEIFSLIIWIIYLPFGVVAFIVGLAQTVVLVITIIGIPLAVIVVKSLGVYFKPIGKVCVPLSVGNELRRRKADEDVKKYLGDN